MIRLAEKEGKKSDDIAIWIQYTNVTDGRTDIRTYGRTPADSKDRAYTQRRAVKMMLIFSAVQ